MRFAIEHLPKAVATYQVTPVSYAAARTWLTDGELTSLVRTTEMVGAIGAGFGLALEQADASMVLQPGDEALLICLSFSVLLAWSQGGIAPMEDDWRCLLLQVHNPQASLPVPASSASLDLTAN